MGKLQELCEEHNWVFSLTYDVDMHTWRGQLFSELGLLLAQTLNEDWAKASGETLNMGKRLVKITGKLGEESPK